MPRLALELSRLFEKRVQSGTIYCLSDIVEESEAVCFANTIAVVINPNPFTLIIRSIFSFNSLSSSAKVLISISDIVKLT
ncbi:hypothetical protein Barb4_03541 [Bacteroidales bacterium Barb4]|nr:hypothetical protein Barb4_03541 [Bacteroidales bacterium Barb4]